MLVSRVAYPCGSCSSWYLFRIINCSRRRRSRRLGCALHHACLRLAVGLCWSCGRCMSALSLPHGGRRCVIWPMTFLISRLPLHWRRRGRGLNHRRRFVSGGVIGRRFCRCWRCQQFAAIAHYNLAVGQHGLHCIAVQRHNAADRQGSAVRQFLRLCQSDRLVGYRHAAVKQIACALRYACLRLSVGLCRGGGCCLSVPS